MSALRQCSVAANRCSFHRLGDHCKTVFRKSYDLSAVIDRARLPVISAESREGFHVEVLPQKRATRKVGAESANVFAVRVQGIRFGITHYLPPVVDLAPVHETVLPSERAEVDLDSVDDDRIAS